jgi:hypothetical protein
LNILNMLRKYVYAAKLWTKEHTSRLPEDHI